MPETSSGKVPVLAQPGPLSEVYKDQAWNVKRKYVAYGRHSVIVG